MLEIGSYSGLTETNDSLKQVNFDFLKQRKKEINAEYYNDVSINDFNKELFINLFDFMILNNAKEITRVDDCDSYKLIVIEESDNVEET